MNVSVSLLLNLVALASPAGPETRHYPMPQDYLRTVVEFLPQEIRRLPSDDQKVTFVLLFFSLVLQESRFNPRAVSPVGARGLTQMMPATAQDVAKELRMESYDLTNPRVSLRMGAYYFAQFVDQYGIDHITVALASYNAGPARAKRILQASTSSTFAQGISKIPETRVYVEKIKNSLKHYRRLHDRQVREALRLPASARLQPPAVAAKPADKAEKPKKWFRVVAAYADTRQTADDFAGQLRTAEIAVYVAPETDQAGKKRFRVQAGVFKNQFLAKELLSVLKETVFPDAVIMEIDPPKK